MLQGHIALDTLVFPTGTTGKEAQLALQHSIEELRRIYHASCFKELHSRPDSSQAMPWLEGLSGKMDWVSGGAYMTLSLTVTRLSVCILNTVALYSSARRHGTGHGVGHFLNVHEGPHGIGVRIGK